MAFFFIIGKKRGREKRRKKILMIGAARACEGHIAMERMLRNRKFCFWFWVFGDDFAELWNHFVELLYMCRSYFLFFIFHPYLPFM